MRPFAMLVLAFVTVHASAQVTDSLEQAIELLQDDRHTVLDFTAFRNGKINLNTCRKEHLQRLNYLTAQDIQNLLDYRKQSGPFIDLLELQQCRLSNATIELLHRDCIIYDSRNPIKAIRAKHVVYLRSSLQLQRSKAYLGDTTLYAGSANSLGMRYRGKFNERFEAGINLEKDAGERLISRGKPDFANGFVALYNVGRLKTVLFGNYALNIGQGLSYGSGFNTGKSTLVLNTRNTAPMVRPNTSMNENFGLCGLYVQSQNDIALYAGNQRLDASMEDHVITSVRTSGLHRTASELDGKDILNERIVGCVVQRRFNALNLGLNLSHVHYDGIMNTARINRNHITYGNLFYDFQALNGQWFGEITYQFNGATALLNGVHFALDKTFQLALLHRRYSSTYYHRHSRAFASSSIVSNEEGLYTGFAYTLSKKWQFSGYVDMSRALALKNAKHLKYRQDWLFQAVCEHSKSVSIYVRFQFNRSTVPTNQNESLTDLTTQDRLNQRLQLDWTIDDQLSARTRLEFNHVLHGNSGYLGYQDFTYKWRKKPVRIITRVALLSIDDHLNRIYAYENNLALLYSVPAYQHRGLRQYVIISSPLHHRIHFSMRFAQDLRTDNAGFGSGNDEISGRRRSSISAQLKYTL